MTQSQKILIVTQEFDVHTDFILHELEEMGHQPIRLHMSHIPCDSSWTIALDNDGYQAQFSIPSFHVDLSEIQSIWWRRPSAFAFPNDFPSDEKNFARKEWRHTLRGLWSLSDCYWVSRPERIRHASAKPEQLKRAMQLGFDIPDTLITTNPEQVRAFYDKHNGNIIYKVMTDPYLGLTEKMMARGEIPEDPLRIVRTTRVEEAHLANLSMVRSAPCLFQAYIPKSIELRVTVIGDELFTAEIDSQTNEATKLDWRNYTVDIPYRTGTLPDDIQAKCHAFVKSYGLNYSALDFIRTPDGRYVFIENNPNGQFMFLQLQIPELKLKEAMASLLARGGRAL